MSDATAREIADWLCQVVALDGFHDRHAIGGLAEAIRRGLWLRRPMRGVLDCFVHWQR